jgi:hypothetical protein
LKDLIVLDYNNFIHCYKDLQSTKDLSSLSGWPQALDDTWFLGGQIFKVGNTDFTTDYPLLGFARHLKAVCYQLAKNPNEAYVYFEAGWEVNRQLIFYGDGGEVFIRQTNLIGEPKILASARASLHELEVKSSAYLCRVFDYCCSLVPHLRHRDDIERWLKDLTHVTTLESELKKSSDRSKELFGRP